MKLDVRRTLCVGASFLSIMAFWQLYDQVVPLMLVGTFRLGETIIGLIMALDNLLALALLPLFGILSDRTRTRLGRRMPYIVVGTLLSALLASLLPGAAGTGSLGIFIGVQIALVIAMGIYRAPAVALMPDVTAKPMRSLGNAVINLMGGLGGVIALVLISRLAPDVHTSATAYQPLFYAISGIMLLSLVIMLLTIRENRLVQAMNDIHYGVDRYTEQAAQVDNTGRERLTPPLRKSLLLICCSVALWYVGYNAVTSAYSRYAQAVWGQTVAESSRSMLVANAGAILSFLPVGLISGRVGRKRMILLGVTLLAVCFAAMTLMKAPSWLLYVLFVLIGCAWACINVNSYPMVVDLSRGGNIGRFTGYYYVAAMIAQIIAPILSGHLLERVGYWTLFPFAAITTALALISMHFVRHGDIRRCV